MNKVLYFPKKKKGLGGMYSVYDIAAYILGREIPNMAHKKLQKLCYYVQAWALAIRGERLIDCTFEAWVHGPVSPELYQICKRSMNTVDGQEPNNLDLKTAEFVDVILSMYGSLTGEQLETLTHSEEPWKQARGELPYWQGSRRRISEDIMSGYYRKELERI